MSSTHATIAPFTDPFLNQQWHLHNTGQSGGVAGIDLNVFPVWDKYSGKGVLVGVVDDGIEFNHPDIAANINTAKSFGAGGTNGEPQVDVYLDSEGKAQIGDAHGMSCAGLVGAVAGNGVGGVGVAHGATLASIYMDFRHHVLNQTQPFKQALAGSYDVLSCSWGSSAYYNWSSIEEWKTECAEVTKAIAEGRDGKGMNIVFAAGNEHLLGGYTSLSLTQMHPGTIAVGAIDHSGKASVYSTPGASILVSAPSNTFYIAPDAIRDEGGIVTTDRQGFNGYNSNPSPEGDMTSTFGGTSAACPQVAGVVALMLEANANLGYRDVQEILAISARATDLDSPFWSTNSAGNWNGGGMHYHTQMGYGLTDAQAAVKLAESWHTQQTAANLKTASGSAQIEQVLPNGDGRGVSSTITLDQNIDVEHAIVFLTLDHTYGPDVLVKLTSPDGVTATLMDVRKTAENFPDKSSEGRPVLGQEAMTGVTTLSAVNFWGGSSKGEWKLEVFDRETNFRVGTLHNWTLEVSGKEASEDDTYFFTNEYAALVQQDSSRGVIHDAEGHNTLNFAAVTGDVHIDLYVHEDSRIHETSLFLTPGTHIQSVIAGDGNDTIADLWHTDTKIVSGRGNDSILLREGGSKTVDGGEGFNTVFLQGMRANYTVHEENNTVYLTGLSGETSVLQNISQIAFADQYLTLV